MKNTVVKQQNQRIKIFFLIPSLTNGGSERVFSILCNHLDSTTFDITLVVLDGHTSFYTIDESRVRLIDLKTTRVRQAFPKIFRLIRSERPDIVVSTLSHLNLFMSLIRPFLPKNTRFIARESIVLSLFNRIEKHGNWRDKLTKRLYPTFDLIICQSKPMANDFEKNYNISPKRLKIINNPIDTEGVYQKALKADVKPKIAPLRLVSVGRLAHPKGFDTILHILSTLNSLDFEYFIIGDGEERHALETLAHDLGLSKRVTFLGVQNNPFGWVASADLYLLPSRMEGFPNVLIEAGAVGTPSIAFSCGGISEEIIEDEMNGIVVKDGENQAFGDAILRGPFLNFNRDDIRKKTAEKFNVEKIIAQYEAAFLNVIDK
jgi:glycosyltransferase involved in cell wall biosynthesis